MKAIKKLILVPRARLKTRIPLQFRRRVCARLCGAMLAIAGAVLGSDPDVLINRAGKSELPSGNGPAAPYSGEAGLKTNEQVIFADDFESGNLGDGWDETGNKEGKVLQFGVPAADAGLEKRCLRVEAHLGKDTGGGLTKWFEPADTVFIRFYTQFDPDCDYVHHFVTLRANPGLRGGDKWSGFGRAGLKPEGSERFSTAIGQLKANALTLESYITDTRTKNPVNVVWFDNVVMARRYIGPVAKP